MERVELNSIEEILADIKAGKAIVMMDDENRENEGDIIFAAEHATTENVNLMAKWARGLICMPTDQSYADKYHLAPMCAVNTDNHETAFTASYRPCYRQFRRGWHQGADTSVAHQRPEHPQGGWYRPGTRC